MPSGGAGRVGVQGCVHTCGVRASPAPPGWGGLQGGRRPQTPLTAGAAVEDDDRFLCVSCVVTFIRTIAACHVDEFSAMMNKCAGIFFHLTFGRFAKRQTSGTSYGSLDASSEPKLSESAQSHWK